MSGMILLSPSLRAQRDMRWATQSDRQVRSTRFWNPRSSASTIAVEVALPMNRWSRFARLPCHCGSEMVLTSSSRVRSLRVFPGFKDSDDAFDDEFDQADDANLGENHLDVGEVKITSCCVLHCAMFCWWEFVVRILLQESEWAKVLRFDFASGEQMSQGRYAVRPYVRGNAFDRNADRRIKD